MGIDYYGVLQITRTATNLEVKKAYRKLALEFNPERLKDPVAGKVFALIGEAYDVLSAPLTRAVFDQYGEEGLKNGVPGPKNTYIHPYHYHGEPLRTYKEFFGTMSPYADLLDYLENPPMMYDGPKGKVVLTKQPPIRHPLCLTLHEVFFGGVKKMKIHRLVFMDETRSRTEVREKILNIPIKPGIRPATEVTFPEEGDQSPIHIPADIIFVVEDRPHEVFHREGDDLVMTWKVSLEESLLGTMVTVKTIDHRTIRVPITDVVFFDYEKVVENEGMPVLENYPAKGNLRIKFQIEFPPYLPKPSKELLRRGFELARSFGGSDQESINKMVLADKILRVDPDEQKPPLSYY